MPLRPPHLTFSSARRLAFLSLSCSCLLRSSVLGAALYRRSAASPPPPLETALLGAAAAALGVFGAALPFSFSARFAAGEGGGEAAGDSGPSGDSTVSPRNDSLLVTVGRRGVGLSVGLSSGKKDAPAGGGGMCPWFWSGA